MNTLTCRCQRGINTSIEMLAKCRNATELVLIQAGMESIQKLLLGVQSDLNDMSDQQTLDYQRSEDH